MALAQPPLLQSAPAEQVWPFRHPEHRLPPQSTSLSAPFFTLSVQLAAWHLLPKQIALWQSLACAQARGAAHLGHMGPPQSTSVSRAFFAVSLQLAI